MVPLMSNVWINVWEFIRDVLALWNLPEKILNLRRRTTNSWLIGHFESFQFVSKKTVVSDVMGWAEIHKVKEYWSENYFWMKIVDKPVSNQNVEKIIGIKHKNLLCVNRELNIIFHHRLLLIDVFPTLYNYVIVQCRDGTPFPLNILLNITGHILNGLVKLNDCGLHHGRLTPKNICWDWRRQNTMLANYSGFIHTQDQDPNFSDVNFYLGVEDRLQNDICSLSIVLYGCITNWTLKVLNHTFVDAFYVEQLDENQILEKKVKLSCEYVHTRYDKLYGEKFVDFIIWMRKDFKKLSLSDVVSEFSQVK
jgi:hypothetical protein